MKISIIGEKRRANLVFCLLLAAAYLALVLAACSSPGSGGEENKIHPEGETTGEAVDDTGETKKPDARSVLEALPSADFGAYEFRIWTSNWFNATLEGRQAPEQEQTGDPVNDALYIRDRLVEEKYNISIAYTIIDNSDQLLSNSKKSIQSGENEFDFGMDNMIIYTKGLAQNGMLVDFNKIPNIDLTREWWSKYAVRDLTINGSFFFATGDITARYPGSQYLMLFNKKLFSDTGLDYPYQTIRDGNWTLDALFAITKDKANDINGDGILDKNDSYGLVVENMAPFCFLQSCGEGLIKIVDGNPTLNAKNERTIAIFEKLASVWSDPQYVYYPKNYVVYDEVPVFKEDRALFVAMTGTNTSLYKDMESDFGIIPLPKYDAFQSEYYSYCQPWGSASVCVPVTTRDLDRTGMIMEALAAAGRYTSTVAVYDITLKTKYARDEESEAMLDIICEGSCYDFAFIYDWGGLYSQFVNAVNKGESFVSAFEKIESKAQTAMEKTIEAYAAGE